MTVVNAVNVGAMLKLCVIKCLVFELKGALHYRDLLPLALCDCY